MQEVFVVIQLQSGRCSSSFDAAHCVQASGLDTERLCLPKPRRWATGFWGWVLVLAQAMSMGHRFLGVGQEVWGMVFARLRVAWVGLSCERNQYRARYSWKHFIPNCAQGLCSDIQS
jgi:hypothetical protein